MNHMGNDTKARLLGTTMKLIEKVGMNAVTSTLVLNESGVSKSSMYHFFEDFDDLLVEAQILQYGKLDDSWCRSIRELSSASSTSDEFYSGLIVVLKKFHKDQKRHIRFIRVSIMVNTKASNILTKTIGNLQEALIVELTQAFELAQAKGFLVGTYPPRSMAIVLQVLMFGKIFDDTLQAPMEDKDWATLTSGVLKDAFLKE